MIGKKLKHLREERKYTQEGVALDLGVKLSTYSDYEREISRVPAEVVIKASEYYKKGLDYFYSLRGPVHITMNDHASNGYIEQQQNVDKGLYERMLDHMDERSKKLEELYARSLEILDRLSKGK